jgi:hypothetical protein
MKITKKQLKIKKVKNKKREKNKKIILLQQFPLLNLFLLLQEL